MGCLLGEVGTLKDERFVRVCFCSMFLLNEMVNLEL